VFPVTLPIGSEGLIMHSEMQTGLLGLTFRAQAQFGFGDRNHSANDEDTKKPK